MSKQRLDLILVDRGFADSRTQAQRLIMAGLVRIDGQLVDQASTMLSEEVKIELVARPKFVSRGGEKLEAALREFAILVEEAVCADVGASTGGFTDCLLQYGAAKVYAIDVGKGQLHWKLRKDPCVIVMEETNARFLERLPEPIDIVTIDASFISLKTLLPVVRNWLRQIGWLVALIKPQFEAGKKEASRGKGVIRDPLIHRRLLEEVIGFAGQEKFSVVGLIPSPILGPKGNKEFLLIATKSEKAEPVDMGLVQKALA